MWFQVSRQEALGGATVGAGIKPAGKVGKHGHCSVHGGGGGSRSGGSRGGSGGLNNRQSLLRLAGAVLEEQNDEWLAGHRYFSQESMLKLLEPTPDEVAKALLELESA